MIAYLPRRVNEHILFVFSSFLLFTALAFYYGIKSSIFYSAKGVPVYWFHLSYHYLASGWTWTLLMPLLLVLPRSFYKKGKYIPIIIILCLPISVIHRLVSLLSDNTFRWLMEYTPKNPVDAMLSMKPLFVTGLFDSIVAYFVINLIVLFYYNMQGESLVWGLRPNTLEQVKGKTSPVTTEEESEKITNRLVVKKNGRWVFIEKSDINWFKSEGNYLKIFYGTEWVMVRGTMKGMLKKLDSNLFYRVNRSTIINANFIRAFEPWYNGEYTITLLDGIKVNTSKTYKSSVKYLLKR